MTPTPRHLHMGVPCVRIIDPTSRTGRQCIGHAWTAAETLEVPGTKIQVNLLELLLTLMRAEKLTAIGGRPVCERRAFRRRRNGSSPAGTEQPGARHGSAG